MKNCDCIDECQRWGFSEDHSIGFFCPYIPNIILKNNNIEETLCKVTLPNHNMKPHTFPNKIEKETNVQ